MLKRLLIFLLLLIATVPAWSTPTPALYFTDLVSGPVGSIVTVYGANLSGSVVFNGVTATTILASPTKVSFVVPNTSSGSITVGASNALSFTIAAGNIYYVATNGLDTNPGTEASPWGTIPFAYNAAACGDTIYVKDGVRQTTADAYLAALAIRRKCTLSTRLALIGYPGALVVVGDPNGLEFGIRNPDVNGDNYNGIVLANLTIRGHNEALKDVGNTDWRIVGNDFSCPNGGGQSACVVIDVVSNVQFYGNAIHEAGQGGAIGTKYYHSFYATTNSNHVDVGWNHIFHSKSCRGIQFNSTSGSPQFDLLVHDNIISDQACDGINFATVDASKGPVKAYNNLVYHVGFGDPAIGQPNEACYASLGYGGVTTGQAEVYGNTFIDCGSAGGSTAGALTVQTGSPPVLLTDNLILLNPGEVLYSPGANQSLFTLSSNVIRLTGTSGVVDALYKIVASSPAIGAGIAESGILYDLAGLPRPQSGTVDAGAYLYNAGDIYVAVYRDGTGAGWLTGTNCTSGSYAPGTTVSCTATADSASTFAGWSGACSGLGTTCTFTPGANTTVYASFMAPSATHSLTITKTGLGNGTVTGTNCTTASALLSASAVTCTATADASSTFGVFTGTGSAAGCATASTCTFALNADSTLSASFNPAGTYTLAVSVSGKGTVTGCLGPFAAGQHYTCTIIPDLGYRLVSITGCNGTLSTPTYSGVMTAQACIVSAAFATGPSSTWVPGRVPWVGIQIQ